MKKKYWEMNTDELAAETARFDKSFVIDESRPLTPAERAKWNKVRRKRGRPKTGEGFKRITISLERGLARKVDALVKKRKTSRSRLLAQALERLTAQS